MKQKSTNRRNLFLIVLVLILVGFGIWTLIVTPKKEKFFTSPKSLNFRYPLHNLPNSSSPLPQSEQEKQELEKEYTQSPPSEILGIQTFKVVKIIDGDTIRLENGEIVRYIGIDAPESKDCYANESTEKNRELILGKEITMEKNVSETDRYGRILRYVYVGETFINELLVREGFAKAYPYPPDVKYKDLFDEAQKEARGSDRGLWGECASQGPVQNQPQRSRTSTIEGDKDCSDFKTQSEAQAFFLSQGGPEKDPHRLDQDRDGIACETLPQ